MSKKATEMGLFTNNVVVYLLVIILHKIVTWEDSPGCSKDIVEKSIKISRHVS